MCSSFSKLILFIDKILNKLTYLPFYMNEVLTLDNFNKIKESKNLVVTNDRIGISLFPILLYLKFLRR